MEDNFLPERVYPDVDWNTADWRIHCARYMFVRPYCVNKTVLDVGCGSGYATHLYSEVAKQVVGIDYSLSAIKFAREHFNQPIFHIASADNLPLAESQFDVVSSLETIEHVYDNHAFLSDFKRVMRDDAIGIISTHYFAQKLWHSRRRQKYHRWGFTFQFLYKRITEYFDNVYPLEQVNLRFRTPVSAFAEGAVFIVSKHKIELPNPWGFPESPRDVYETEELDYEELPRVEVRKRHKVD